MNITTWKDFLGILESNAHVAQTYQTLLSSLHLLEKSSSSGGALKSLMVSSTQPDEGKTTVCVGLSITMALAGERVLLVDADARKPRIHEIFELSNDRGFTDLLAPTPSVGLSDVSQGITLDGGRPATVHIVPSGKVLSPHANPMESSRLEGVVASACRNYDVVLFDSPPVLAVSDPCFLAPLVNGVIFVVGTGTVQERDAKLAKDRIQKAGGNLLGFVMNRFDDSQDGPGYHPYESYYDRSNA